MSRSGRYTAQVLSQACIAEGIFDLQLLAQEVAEAAVPGQFVALYSRDGSRLLPRPISLCGIDAAQGTIRLVYRVAGAGTAEFSSLSAGENVLLLGPLGNGFPLLGKHPLVVGGGIGIPPMLALAKALPTKPAAVLGYRSSDTFLAAEMKKAGTALYVATDDGSLGTHGTVIDAIEENAVQADVIYACGPTPMLRAVKAYAVKKGISCYLSLEERMACGIGACLACVCKTTQKDAHTNVNNARICKEGPVFAAEEVEL